MKPYFLFFLLLMSCSSNKKQEQSPVSQVPTHSVIFLDKSVSVDLNEAFVKEKYTPILQEIVQNNMQQKGDRIEVWFIHENTQKGKALSLVARTEKPDLTGMNATDREFAQGSYDTDIQRERSVFLQRIIALLSTPNPSSSKKATDILATLTVLNTIASQHTGDTKAYYFSDMIESVTAKERRDFEANPPKNSTEAETWASQDAARLKEKLNSLSGIAVQFILPFEPTSTSRQNNPNITIYWQKLMNELGISEVLEN